MKLLRNVSLKKVKLLILLDNCLEWLLIVIIKGLFIEILNLKIFFLNPKIMGTAAHIHPAIIVFVLVTGEYMAGIAGALLAVPVYSILQTFFFFLKSMVDELEKVVKKET